MSSWQPRILKEMSFLILCRKEKKNCPTLVVCFLLSLKREGEKKPSGTLAVCLLRLETLAFLPVTPSPSSLGRQALVALRVGSYLPGQGSSLSPLHWKADS